MRSSFDRRVLSDAALEFIRACQRHTPCHLGGGAALAGAFLSHRLSRDIDLFCHDATAHRSLVNALDKLAAESSGKLRIQRDGGAFVRAELALADAQLVVDVIHESLPDIEDPPQPIDSIVVESLVDLRASKLTCVLSRAEPRDLVDLCFLDRSGYPPDADIAMALKKDAGTDPAILAWLLSRFPVEPLPSMLLPFSVDELRQFRDLLAERFKKLAVPSG